MWFAKSPPPPDSADLPANTNVHMVEGGQGGEIDPMAASAPAPKLQTGLILTEEQESKMVERALLRIDELRTEMGLVDNGATDGIGWMWEREKNQMQYDNDWAWRAALGGIFAFSNFSLNVAKRFARLMAAKTRDDLIGTEPFFAAMPTKHGSPEQAKEQEWYLQEKVALSNAKRALADGQKTALIRNEATLKTSYVSNVSFFNGPAEVAVGPFEHDTPAGVIRTMPGEPILTPRGEFIYREDDVLPDPNVQGLMRLKKEPTMAFRYSFEFQRFPSLRQKLVSYEGLDVRVLDYRDFLCPLNVATTEEADINVHLFDDYYERLCSIYGAFAVAEAYVAQGYVSGEKAAKENKGEVEGASQILKPVHAADVYMRADVDGDGFEEEVWLVLDLRAKRAIWYDYLGNHMPQRPFGVIPGVERVPNRWYGVGVFEMLAHKQLYIDTQFNRVNFKSSKSSGVRFRVKNAVAQWKAGQKLVIGDDQILDVEDPRFDAKNPPLYQVNLHEVDEYAMKLIELMIQAGQTEVGIVGPDDGAMAGLDSTKLATGIKSLERTGNVLMKDTESEQAVAIATILDQCVNVIMEHMDEDELIYRSDTGALIALNREEIRKMKQDVKLLLTRSRSTETIETARMVIQLCREYYEALNPYEQYKLRDEYLRQLKALETPDADALLDEITPEAAQAWLDQSKQPPTIPPKTSIATKYPDLERSEQMQVLQREGIQPATPEEVQASQREDIHAEVTKEVEIARGTAEAKAKFPTGGGANKPGGGSKSKSSNSSS